MAKQLPATTLKWCQQESAPLFDGFRMTIRSQIGYEGRRLEKRLRRKALQTVVAGGSVVDPLNPKAPTSSQQVPSAYNVLTRAGSPSELLERANVIAVGLRTFANMFAQGKYPGSGGYTVGDNGEKKFVGESSTFPKDVIPSLKFFELFTKGLTSTPMGSMPTLFSMALSTIEKASDGRSGSMFTGEATIPNIPMKVYPVEHERSTVELTPIDKSLTKEEADFLIKAAKSVDHDNAELALFGRETPAKPVVYRPKLPQHFSLKIDDNLQSLSESKESAVPSSRLGRLATFGQLAVGLASGAAAEVTRRTFRFGQEVVESPAMPSNPFLSPANADRIVATLCRVRGAALKIGQMLSIQDSTTVPPALLEVFERVRQSADFMPIKQLNRQMAKELGDSWRDKFESFEDRPFAAASIGQVHRAVTKTGKSVAVKVQYPGVAEGIDSDINNLMSVLSVSGLFPKGMFLEEFVKVARRELIQECDYEREARAMRKFRELVAGWEDVYIPEVVDELSSKNVLTGELVLGKPVDACINESQVVRDYIAGKFIELCLKEIFVWRFMQTDPNWSNFLLGQHPKTSEPRLVLLDFGASRAYKKVFVDSYMKIIKAAYDGDKKKIIEYSREIGFLTGYESSVMEDAHVESVLIMGETLASNTPYDFANQNVTARIQKLLPVMLEHRLTSPPEEIYSLHRKLSGCYLLAAKLKATVSCGGLFAEIYDNYKFGEDGKDIDIDSPNV